ncbi:uncharacterized protein LOC133036003 [Cannabis sativa]|uniref:uncharacterized protein LOC133036003 n=1 Tax=Cannabis sativa TaxID=3483 RepID=UPI0029CA8276|nr:uncharacterized protein LOC133036003 [Cannabis sativa]
MRWKWPTGHEVHYLFDLRPINSEYRSGYYAFQHAHRNVKFLHGMEKSSKEHDFKTLYFFVKDIGTKHTKFQMVDQFEKPSPTIAMYERALVLAQLPDYKKDLNILTSPRALDDFGFNFVVTPSSGVREIPRPLGPPPVAQTAIAKSTMPGSAKKRPIRECDPLDMAGLLRQTTYQEKEGSPSTASPMAPPGKVRKTNPRLAIDIHTPTAGSPPSSRPLPPDSASGSANDTTLIGSTSTGAESLAALPLEGRCQALSTGLKGAHGHIEGLMDIMDKTMSRLDCLPPAQIVALGCREMIRAATITSYGQSRVLALQEEHNKQGAASLQLELDALRQEYSQKIRDLETSVERVTAEKGRFRGELESVTAEKERFRGELESVTSEKERFRGELESEKEAHAKVVEENNINAKECEKLAAEVKQIGDLSTDVFFKFWLNNKKADFNYLGKNMESMLSYCRNREEAETREKAQTACIQADSYLNFGVEATDDCPLDDLLDGSY